MRIIIKNLCFLFLFCLAMLIPCTAKAATTLSTKSTAKTITINVKTTEKEATHVDVTITGGGLWKLHNGTAIKNGTASVTYKDLFPGTSYEIEAFPYKEIAGNRYYYSKATTKASTKKGKISAYKGLKAAGEAIYKDFAKGKNGTYMVKTKSKINAYEAFKPYIYNNAGKKMGCILREYQHIVIYPENVYNVKSGSYYYTSITTSIGYTMKENSASKFSKSIKKADKIVKKLKPKMRGKNKKEKIYILYNYLAKNCSYKKNCEDDGNPYGSLVRKRALCSGYATGFALLCKRAGFNAVPIDGVQHMYVAVSIDGKVYLCDPTLDDNGSFADKTFFMKTKNSDFFKKSYTHDLKLAKQSLKEAYGFSGKF